MTEILLVSSNLSIGTLQGLLLVYITLSYLNWPRNGELSKFEVQKKCLNYDDLCSKMHLFQTFFQTSNFDCSPFLGQLRQERVIYLKRKHYNVLFESNAETERISVMKGSTRVLVKIVLFQLKGCGHPQDDTMPNFFPNSKSLLLGLSNEISFVSRYYQKGG